MSFRPGVEAAGTSFGQVRGRAPLSSPPRRLSAPLLLVVIRSILRTVSSFPNGHAPQEWGAFFLELDITIKNHGWLPRDFAGGCAEAGGVNWTV